MNFIINREQILPLQKEITKLKSENAILKQVISDYQSGNIGTNKLAQEIPILEAQTSVDVKESLREREKVSVPLWKLTASERELLTILITEKDRPISRADLAFKIWGQSDTNSRMTRLSTITNNLRDKLKIEDSNQSIINTHWGEGYQLANEFFEHYKMEDQFFEQCLSSQK